MKQTPKEQIANNSEGVTGLLPQHVGGCSSDPRLPQTQDLHPPAGAVQTAEQTVSLPASAGTSLQCALSSGGLATRPPERRWPDRMAAEVEVVCLYLRAQQVAKRESWLSSLLVA